MALCCVCAMILPTHMRDTLPYHTLAYIYVGVCMCMYLCVGVCITLYMCVCVSVSRRGVALVSR